MLLSLRDVAYALRSTIFFFSVLSECLFISPECRPYFLTFLLAAVQATNKTILQREDLKGEGGAFLDQYEGERRCNICI